MNRYKYIYFALICGSLLWVLDAATRTYTTSAGSFINFLLYEDLDASGLIVRLVPIIIVFVIAAGLQLWNNGSKNALLYDIGGEIEDLTNPAVIFQRDEERYVMKRYNRSVIENASVNPDEFIGLASDEIWPDNTSLHLELQECLAKRTSRLFHTRFPQEGLLKAGAYALNISAVGRNELLLQAMILKPEKSSNTLSILDRDRFWEMNETVPVGVFRTGYDGKLQYANRQMVELLKAESKKQLLKTNAESLYFDPADRRKLLEILEREGVAVNFESRLKRFDGKTIWVLMNIRSIVDDSGSTVSLDGSMLDVTEMKKAEEERARSEANLSTLIENNNYPIASYDNEKRLITFNRAYAHTMKEAFGMNIKPGDRLMEKLPVAVRQTYDDTITKVLAGERISKTAAVNYRDGKTHYFDYRYSPVIHNHNVTGCTVTIIDTTEQQASMETLRRFREAVDNSGDSIFIYDRKNDRFVDVNTTACLCHGYTRDELVNMSPFDLIDGKEVTKVRNRIMDIVGAGESAGVLDTVNKRKDGSKFPVEVNFRIINSGDGDLVIATARDLTERLQSDEALHKHEVEYRQLFENAGEGICIIQDFHVVVYNPRFQEYLNLPSEKISATPFYEFIYEEDREYVVNNHKRRLNGESILNDYDFRVVDGNGDVHWLRLNAVNIDYKNKPATLCFLNDVTESREVQKALKDSEELFRTLVEKMGEGVGIVDPEDSFVFANPAADSLFGVESGKLVGRNLDEFVSPEGYEFIMKQTALRQAGKESTYEIELLCRNEDRKTIIVTATPLYDDIVGDFKGVLGVFRDVTHLKKMEEDITRADKMQSIGILAGGIAHDFNNILTAVLGNLSLSMIDMAEDSKIYKRLFDAEHAALRAQDLTMQLLTFSKGGAPVRKAASVAELIRGSAEFVLRGSNVSVNYDIPDNLSPANIDLGQISQVINNLVINADQAMPNGGEIGIRVRDYEHDEIDNTSLIPGKYIRIDISDTGCGIDPDNLQRIFDPYFTTKDDGNGLGLATTYSIVRRHDGLVEVKSEPGQGTTFTIYLPATAEGNSDFVDHGNQNWKGEGRILVMDDEYSILNVAAISLKKMGFETDLTQNGQDAVDRYREAFNENNRYKVVLMDLTIPGGMGGEEAIAKILEIDPEVTAIVTSGYSNNPIMADYSSYGFKGYIKKPFKFQDLKETLRTVLSRGNAVTAG